MWPERGVKRPTPRPESFLEGRPSDTSMLSDDQSNPPARRPRSRTFLSRTVLQLQSAVLAIRVIARRRKRRSGGSQPRPPHPQSVSHRPAAHPRARRFRPWKGSAGTSAAADTTSTITSCPTSTKPPIAFNFRRPRLVTSRPKSRIVPETVQYVDSRCAAAPN